MKSKLGAAALMLLVAVALTQCRGGDSAQVGEALPGGIDLTSAKQVEIQTDAGQVVMNGTFENGKTLLTSTDPTSHAKGAADFEVEKKGDGSEQEIEATVQDLPANTSFKLVVDGREVATFMTGSDGKHTMKFTRKDGA